MEHSEAGSSSAVIVGDNGLAPKFRDKWPRVTFVTVETPFVYGAAINQCAATVPDSDLLIIGDDAEIMTPDWLTKCEQLSAGWPSEYGLLNLSEPSTSELYGASGAPFESESLVAFVATLIPRGAWNEIGAMDLRYTGYGYDDFDYCVRLLHAGYRLGITDAATIKHVGSATYGSDIRELTTRNMELFSRKWQTNVPLGFPSAKPHFRRQECDCASISS